MGCLDQSGWISLQGMTRFWLGEPVADWILPGWAIVWILTQRAIHVLDLIFYPESQRLSGFYQESQRLSRFYPESQHLSGFYPDRQCLSAFYTGRQHWGWSCSTSRLGFMAPGFSNLQLLFQVLQVCTWHGTLLWYSISIVHPAFFLQHTATKGPLPEDKCFKC